MTVATVAISASATKIYVCGTKITGTTSFSAGNGTVSYNDNTRTLTISNVNYTKTGSSNNGISVDEVSGPLTINMTGSVSFDIGNADAVLCKSGKTTYINISGTATFLTRSSGHAALKLQDGDVYVQGSGSLTLKHTSSGSGTADSHAAKGGAGTEKLTFSIKNCTLESPKARVYNLNKLTISPTGSFGSDDYSTKITFKQAGSTVHASSINEWGTGAAIKIFKPFEYYGYSINLLANSTLSSGDAVVSDVNAVAVFSSSYFPDANFRSYLYGLYSKGYITPSDVNSRTSLTPSSKSISSLQGVEYFTQLTYLNCSSNSLTSLNLSALTKLTSLDCHSNNLVNLGTLPSSLQTINCSNNKFASLSITEHSSLTSLDISNTTSINTLYCYNNALTSLNVAGCSALTIIDCEGNQLTSLGTLPNSVQVLRCKNNKFTTLSITGHSALKTLEIAYNPDLTTLNCYGNALSALNFYGCSALTTLDCHNNQIYSLDNLPTTLQTLNCSSNKFGGAFILINHSALKTLDVSNNTSITSLTCYNNGLTSLNVSGCPALTSIDCHSNKFSGTFSLTGHSALKTLNISNNPYLTTLNCYSNSLTSLDVNSCSAITTLICHSNALTSLNVNGCSAMTTLNCYSNQLTSLGTLPSSLQTLDCSSNLFSGTFSLTDHSALKTLIISNNPSITALYCHSNALTSLNVTSCSAMTLLDCHNNQLTEINNIPSSLVTLNCSSNKFSGTFSLTGRKSLNTLNISNNPSITTLNCYNNGLTSLNLNGCSALTTLDCHANKFTQINNIPTALESLNCNNNYLSGTFTLKNRSALKTLDISSNPYLTELNCSNNSLISLNVENCTGLEKLICSFNNLSSLNLSGLNNITELDCQFNDLIYLNLTNKQYLGTLYANNNQLQNIIFQGCYALEYLYCGENRLTTLHLDDCMFLYHINCELNSIWGEGMDILVNSLRTIPAGNQGTLEIVNDSGSEQSNYMSDAQVRAARNKRWLPKKWNGNSWVEIPVGAVPGDVNGNGEVTAADVTAIYNWLLNNDASSLVNGDPNGDGNITAADVTFIYNIMLCIQ